MYQENVCVSTTDTRGCKPAMFDKTSAWHAVDQ